MIMVMSMTGYGNEIFHLENDTVLHVEIRTVNSRYLDFKAHIPRSLYHLEIPMKKLIQSYIERGRVDLYITTIGSTLEDRSLHVDWADRKSTRLNSSHVAISYAVFCLKK